jgi:hypothetical protein
MPANINIFFTCCVFSKSVAKRLFILTEERIRLFGKKKMLKAFSHLSCLVSIVLSGKEKKLVRYFQKLPR